MCVQRKRGNYKIVEKEMEESKREKTNWKIRMYS